MQTTNPVIDSQYLLQKKIGLGGTANVFLADVEEEQVAIKMPRIDKKFTRKDESALVFTEVKTMERVGYHPNIVNMLDYNLEGVICTQGSLRSASYCVYEYCPNGSLYEYVKRFGPLPEPVACFYFHQLVCAIKHLHDQNIAHCDIKPGNIFLDSNFNLKLGDFGCSIQMKGKNYGVTQTFGTRSYMAPEVFKASKKTPFSPFDADIYALGATLYFMTSGETPTVADTSMSSTEEYSDESQYPVPVYIGDLDHLDLLIIDVIEMLISYDPKDRPDISDLLDHPWFEPRKDPDHVWKVYEFMHSGKEKSSTFSS